MKALFSFASDCNLESITCIKSSKSWVSWFSWADSVTRPYITHKSHWSAFIFVLTSCKKFCVPPISIFFHTVPAVLQKGEQTFEKFTCIWNIETIRSHLKFQPFLVFSPSRKQSWSKTVVSLLDLKKQASWFTKRISWYMTRNTWELKLNSTILTRSKKQVDVYCIDLDSEFVDLNYIVASLIFCHFWRSILRADTWFWSIHSSHEH